MNTYKNMKQVENAFKACGIFGEIIIACHIKIYWYEMTMNEKLTITNLMKKSSKSLQVIVE